MSHIEDSGDDAGATPGEADLTMIPGNNNTPPDTPVLGIPAGSFFRAHPRRKSYFLSGGKQITRSRVSYSCYTCRRRKVKCDKVHPACGTCVKTGMECHYDPNAMVRRSDLHDHSQHGIRRRKDQAKRKEGGRLADFLYPYEAAGLRETQRSLESLQDQRQGGSSQEIAARLDRLKSMIDRLSRTGGPPESLQDLDQALRLNRTRHDGADSLLPALATSRKGSVAGASSQLTSRPSSPRRRSEQGTPEDFPIPTGHATDLVDPVGSLNLGHLSLEDGGKSRYVGTTYWAYISDEINELNRLLRDQGRSHQLSPPPTQDEQLSPVNGDHRTAEIGGGTLQDHHQGDEPWRSSPADNFQRPSLFSPADSFSMQEKVIEPEMLDHIPTKRQSDILYKGFMSGVQAISPVVHPPSVLSLYKAFWDWYENYSHQQCPDPSFIPLLYAIWYCGSVTISLRTINAEFDVESRTLLSGPFHDEVSKWLRWISFPRNASLNGLSAFLLVQTILTKEEEPLTTSLFVSLVLRVAQTMGLHRDPAQFRISACEAETRRRVWWHIVHMDGVVAMSSGLPPLVSEQNYWDVRYISEVKDTLLGSAAADEYERKVNEGVTKPDKPDDPHLCGGPSMVNVYYLCATGKYIMARSIRKILKIQLGTKPVTRKDMEDLRSILIELQSKLHEIVDRIPMPKPESSQSWLSGRGSSLQEDALLRDSDHLSGGPGCLEQYHTPVLAAFHKWAKILMSLFVDKAFCVAYQPFLKNAKSKIWPAARQCALRHCHGFMEKFIQLATDPDFQPFQWSWPGNHQPMHATMIMLIDLYERPNSAEAPKSRAFIDRIFSLSGPDGGVVGGEDGISTARPLRDGGREAWDMMRRLREKAWQKAGLDPNVLWTEQAQVQAGVAQTAPLPQQHLPHGKKEYVDRPSTNFADDYYAIIKDSYDSKSPPAPNRMARERQHQEIGNSSLPRRVHDTTQQVRPQQWEDQFSNESSLLQPHIDVQPWQQQHQPSSLQSVHTSHLPFDGLHSHDPTFNPNHLATAPAPSNVGSGGTTSTIAYDHYAHQFPAPHLLRSDAGSQEPKKALDHSATFDWDQWDAVFGQHLPVVDGFMDLDGVASGDNRTGMFHSLQPGSAPGGIGELGLVHGVGDTVNWADFG